MELVEAIKNRHSIRKFTDEKVSKEQMRDLAECAVLAPTTSNMQCWKFIAVTDPDAVRKIALFSPGISGNPSAVMALCTDREEALAKVGEASWEEFACIDISLAAENIMLRAVDMGLGSCAIKSYNEGALAKILDIPSHFKLEYLIILGYPKSEGKSPPRHPMDEVLYFDRYENR